MVQSVIPSSGQSTASPDMLAAFDTITVRNEEKITAADRDFCQRHQRVLTRTLDQLQRWYDLLRQEADTFSDQYEIRYNVNGTVEYRTPYSSNNHTTDYGEFEFRPFDTLNEVVKLYQRVVRRFAGNIIDHFNRQYHLSVEVPDFDKDHTPWGHRPDYTTYVDHVIGYLGGRDFHQVGRQEIIERLQQTLRYGKGPVVIGNKIVLSKICRYNSIALEFQQRYDFYYDVARHIDNICAGLVLAATDRLDGDHRIILGLDQNDVDLSNWYSLSSSAGTAEAVKFYKNGRIDIRFNDHAAALACYDRLQLDKMEAR